ncbi:MAG TPA: hypothetical protein VFU47_13105, partial [Armatimonadota bacterium]|nr:hypothetical protein [Armatimonadota bacterium]
WRMQRHLRRCPACSEQKAAEESLRPLLELEHASDRPEEAAAFERVTRAWLESLPGAPAPRPARQPAMARRWMTVSAAGLTALALFILSAVTAPPRALAQVADAMKRVNRFHIRMEIPDTGLRYEAWGQRGLGTRVEERENGRLTLVVLDDGQKLRSYSPDEQLVLEGKTRLKRIFREAASFNATKMLRQAAKGRLFEGQEWLGEATAREVARVRRDGREQRRLQIDLKDGFFDRMVIYAGADDDRLAQANLYMGRKTPDTQPFARVFFEYPDRLDGKLFRLEAPRGTKVRQEEWIPLPGDGA